VALNYLYIQEIHPKWPLSRWFNQSNLSKKTILDSHTYFWFQIFLSISSKKRKTGPILLNFYTLRQIHVHILKCWWYKCFNIKLFIWSIAMSSSHWLTQGDIKSDRLVPEKNPILYWYARVKKIVGSNIGTLLLMYLLNFFFLQIELAFRGYILHEP
jgi:hypothetical protein